MIVNETTCVTEKSIVLIPFWVEDVLRRNKLTLASVLDYTRVAELMSMEDRSAFLTLQRANKIGLFAGAVNSYLLGSWEQSALKEQKAVLDSAVVPMSYSETAVNDSLERLKLGETPKPECHYKVVDFDRNALGVILYPGCVEALLEKETALALTREILNVFYGYYEVHEVSSLPLFAKYLELIS